MEKNISKIECSEISADLKKANFDSFFDISSKDVVSLIKKGRGSYVLKNLEKCRGLDDSVAKTLIDHGYGNFVARNIGSFDESFHASIAQTLINLQYSFFDYVENFKLNDLFLCYLVDLASHLGQNTVIWNEKLVSLGVNKDYLDDLTARRKYLSRSIVLLQKMGAREAGLAHLKKSGFYGI